VHPVISHFICCRYCGWEVGQYGRLVGRFGLAGLRNIQRYGIDDDRVVHAGRLLCQLWPWIFSSNRLPDFDHDNHSICRLRDSGNCALFPVGNTGALQRCGRSRCRAVRSDQLHYFVLYRRSRPGRNSALVAIRRPEIKSEGTTPKKTYR